LSEHVRPDDRRRCPLRCPCYCELAEYQALLAAEPDLSVAEGQSLERLIVEALRCTEANSPVSALRRYAAAQLVNLRWDRQIKRGVYQQ